MYEYCAGNPIRLVDPDGRFPQDALGDKATYEGAERLQPGTGPAAVAARADAQGHGAIGAALGTVSILNPFWGGLATFGVLSAGARNEEEAAKAAALTLGFEAGGWLVGKIIGRVFRRATPPAVAPKPAGGPAPVVKPGGAAGGPTPVVKPGGAAGGPTPVVKPGTTPGGPTPVVTPGTAPKPVSAAPTDCVPQTLATRLGVKVEWVKERLAAAGLPPEGPIKLEEMPRALEAVGLHPATAGLEGIPLYKVVNNWKIGTELAITYGRGPVVEGTQTAHTIYGRIEATSDGRKLVLIDKQNPGKPIGGLTDDTTVWVTPLAQGKNK